MKVNEALGSNIANDIDELSLTSEDRQFIIKRPKLDEEQLVLTLQNKGIEFNHTTVEDAISIIRGNTYYFKVSVFRKNFSKGIDGKYFGADFASLSDLAILDMRLRRILLGASLDLEHAMKTSILANIAQDSTEDGYKIVRDFFRLSSVSKSEILNKASIKKNYMYPIYRKHKQTLSVWVLFELLSFGEFGQFIEFYYERVNLNKGKYGVPEKLFRYAKNVRNAAAHNNPLLLNLTKGETIKVPKEISKLARKMNLENKFSNKARMIDILSLLHLHSLFCSEGIRTYFHEELKIFRNRCLRNKHLYQKDSLPVDYFRTLNKILAYYANE